MRRVLVIADLEGVAGVDDARELSAASPGLERGRRLLTGELLAVIAGLRARGVEEVLLSDSHRPGGGAPTVRSVDLPAGVHLSWQGDAYDARLFEGVDAVACVGMHAGAGGRGFAAHTISIHCGLLHAQRDLSETEVVLALAAEADVPALLVSGDDALEETVRGPVYVLTKCADSPLAARSRPPAEVRTELERAAREARPVAAARLPGEIVVRFKSRWMAEAAATLGERVGAHELRLRGATFREAYRRALRAIAAATPILERALRLSDPALTNLDVTRLLLRRFPPGAPAPHALEAERALRCFLEATAGRSSSARADRALVLHMLETHAPRVFAAQRLSPVLESSLAALRQLPVAFPIGLDPAEAMARVDGLYLLAERGAPRDFDVAELRAYARWLAGAGPAIWAWLVGELMAQMGHGRPVQLPAPELRDGGRTAELYYLTHLPLLATRYLRRPLGGGLEAVVEELTLAAPEVIAGAQVDLAAEIVLALQAAGEHDVAEHAELLALLRARQTGDGALDEPAVAMAANPAEAARLSAHATGAAALAFAGTVR